MEMEKYELTTHLRQALSLEYDIYAAEELIKMNERQRQTPKPLPSKPVARTAVSPTHTYTMPSLPNKAREVAPVSGDVIMDEVMSNYIWIPIVLAVIAGILGEVFLREAIGGAVVPFIICSIGAMLLGVPVTFGVVEDNHKTARQRMQNVEQAKIDREYQLRLEQYHDNVERSKLAYLQHEREVEEQNKRIQENYSVVWHETHRHNDGVEEANAMLDRILTPIKAELAKMRATLKRVYKLGYIHPKYHNMVAYAMFLEYFDTGRCSQLIGAHGVYNLFEHELTMSRIIDRLDCIIRNLEQIQKNQYYLYCEINQANQNIKHLTSCVNEGLHYIANNQGNLTYEVLQSNQATANMSRQFDDYISHLETTNKEVLKYLEDAKKVDQKLLEATK